MQRKQSGFTLVELVVVLVILGILAGVAIPRYASYVREARIAALSGLAGGIRSGVMMAQSRWVANGATGASVTMLDGVVVTVGTTGQAMGVPVSAAGGIDNAVKIDGFTFTGGPATATYEFSPQITGCNLTYTAATGVVTVNSGSC